MGPIGGANLPGPRIPQQASLNRLTVLPGSSWTSCWNWNCALAGSLYVLMFWLPLSVHWTLPAELTRYAAQVLRNEVRNDPSPVSWIELMW